MRVGTRAALAPPAAAAAAAALASNSPKCSFTTLVHLPSWNTSSSIPSNGSNKIRSFPDLGSARNAAGFASASTLPSAPPSHVCGPWGPGLVSAAR